MKAKLWPNGLGYDVGPDAEVWLLTDGLGVRIYTERDTIKSLFIPDRGLDPIEAVKRCRREGTVGEDYG
jgi:hypothetical protein